MTINERDKNNIYECISELMEMERNSVIRAVAIAVIKEDGDARTLTAVAEGGYKLALVAAATLVQHEALNQLTVQRDPGDTVMKIGAAP